MRSLRVPKVKGLLHGRLVERQVGNQSRNDAADARGEVLTHYDTVRVAAKLFTKFRVGGDTMHKCLNLEFFHEGKRPFLDCFHNVGNS